MCSNWHSSVGCRTVTLTTRRSPIRPMAARATSMRSSCAFMVPTWSTNPVEFAWSINCATSAWEWPSGFSAKTCFPALNAADAISPCDPGVKIMTASTSGSLTTDRQSLVDLTGPDVELGRRSAMATARDSEASQTWVTVNRSRRVSRLGRWTAWVINPRPTMPKRTCATVNSLCRCCTLNHRSVIVNWSGNIHTGFYKNQRASLQVVCGQI